MLWEKTGMFFVPPFVSPYFASFSGVEAGMFAVCIILAAAAKLICFGFHFVMEDGSDMPVPAAAFCFPAVLSGLGMYLLYHCFPFVQDVPNVRTFFVAIGALSAAAGILIALNVTNVKAILSFILMSQFGFVTAAFGLSGEGVALNTFVAMAVPMIGLILSAGNVIYALWGEEDITRMGGLQKEKPFTLKIMWILSFCCVGFPYIGTFGGSLSDAAIITSSGFLGALLDSFLGATIQVKYRDEDGALTEEATGDRVRGIPFIDNDAVNLISGLFSLSLGAALSLL